MTTKHPTGLADERRRIFEYAEYFEQASHILLRRDVEKAITNAPGVVNSAFSLELYFKCLLHIETCKWVRGHHLKTELFDSLTKDHQDRIKAHYAAEAAKGMNGLLINLSLEQHLDSSDDAFPHWRYAFEHPAKTKVYSGAILIPFVRAVILEDVPALRAGR